jgi:hypothetical protein
VIVVRYVDDTVWVSSTGKKQNGFSGIWESVCGSSGSNYARTRRA